MDSALQEALDLWCDFFDRDLNEIFFEEGGFEGVTHDFVRIDSRFLSVKVLRV